MAQPKTLFVCQECGHAEVKWRGNCPSCGRWHTFVEEAETPAAGSLPPAGLGGGQACPLAEVTLEAEERIPTGAVELDRVLGGGLVKGSVVLVGGEPGIGKTTLLLQVLSGMAGAGRRVLYVSGEESARQIRLRAERINSLHQGLMVLVESGLEAIMEAVNRNRPEVLVLDSVQAVQSARNPSPPGTIAQVREAAARLIALAKGSGTSVFLVGHVTKEGSIAGPKVLEHMVDTVLYFESDTGQQFRLIRASKNRYGSTNEVGIFRMEETGLAGVEDPSALFLGERSMPQSGVAIVPCMEGRRPLLIEVQALVASSSFSVGRRSVSGLDMNRVTMLLAVLEKRAGLAFGAMDVYVNAAGGMRLLEPAADLGILLALASSHRGRPLGPSTAAFGEVSLTGEVRLVPSVDLRLREARRLGFRHCFLPRAAAERIGQEGQGMELHFADTVDDLTLQI
jgi:DNA repair protein RadA/Sms